MVMVLRGRLCFFEVPMATRLCCLATLKEKITLIVILNEYKWCILICKNGAQNSLLTIILAFIDHILLSVQFKVCRWLAAWSIFTVFTIIILYSDLI